MADPDLVTRAAGGDLTAFQTLVERHRSMVYRIAYQFAGNHYDAEDIAQEVFLKVYRSLDRFRQDAQLTSWLYRIVMNASNEAQAVVVVVNHASVAVSIEAPGINTTWGAGGYCSM